MYQYSIFHPNWFCSFGVTHKHSPLWFPNIPTNFPILARFGLCVFHASKQYSNKHVALNKNAAILFCAIIGNKIKCVPCGQIPSMQLAWLTSHVSPSFSHSWHTPFIEWSLTFLSLTRFKPSVLVRPSYEVVVLLSVKENRNNFREKKSWTFFKHFQC